jgi:hypothetical protein
VKQVIQALYLFAELLSDVSEDALLKTAEQLVHASTYFRKYVVENEEVIFTDEIKLLAR